MKGLDGEPEQRRAREQRSPGAPGCGKRIVSASHAAAKTVPTRSTPASASTPERSRKPIANATSAAHASTAPVKAMVTRREGRDPRAAAPQPRRWIPARTRKRPLETQTRIGTPARSAYQLASSSMAFATDAVTNALIPVASPRLSADLPITSVMTPSAPTTTSASGSRKKNRRLGERTCENAAADPGVALDDVERHPDQSDGLAPVLGARARLAGGGLGPRR
jgi:hypothetical protein